MDSRITLQCLISQHYGVLPFAMGCYTLPAMATLGKRLKIARLHAKLTQAELAKKASVAQSAVSRIEREEAETSGYAVLFAKICGVRPEWLALENGDMLELDSSEIMAMLNKNPELIRLLKVAAPLGKYQVDVLVQTSTALAEPAKQAEHEHKNNGTQ